jgi:hypothetical protein
MPFISAAVARSHILEELSNARTRKKASCPVKIDSAPTVLRNRKRTVNAHQNIEAITCGNAAIAAILPTICAMEQFTFVKRVMIEIATEWRCNVLVAHLRWKRYPVEDKAARTQSPLARTVIRMVHLHPVSKCIIVRLVFRLHREMLLQKNPARQTYFRIQVGTNVFADGINSAKCPGLWRDPNTQ